MKLRKLAAGLIAAAALSLTSAVASATTGPYYTCIKRTVTDFQGTIVDAAVATPQLSTLVSLVTQAGLASALSTTQNLTVFAPTNDAFAKVDESVLSAIGSNSAVLGAVLGYHVVASAQDPRRWSQPQPRTTLSNQRLYIWHDGVYARVNNSKVNCQGIKTSNGIVWLIDSVLLPQF
jgi:uncharacterized surface protein with fasciclin (FAS1) repeats